MIIYGTGKISHLVIEVLKKHNIPITTFLDKKTLFKNIDKTIPVIVAVFNAQKDSNFLAIKRTLGNREVMSFEEFYQIYADDMPKSIFWLTKKSFYNDYPREIVKVNRLWKDKKSRELYQSLLRHRLKFDFDILPKPSTNTQYVPNDIPLPKPYCLLDLGAFDGDTILSFIKKKLVKQVIAFEPDPDNFKKLVERVRKYRKKYNITLFPFGVGNTFTKAPFYSEGQSSKYCDKGDVDIQVVKLDEFLPDIKPDYIKIDIEGMERKALLGMRNLVEKCQPVMAVSLYHNPQDLFTLPLLISAWKYEADFYLRMYGEHCLETILYCVPRNVKKRRTK